MVQVLAANLKKLHLKQYLMIRTILARIMQ